MSMISVQIAELRELADDIDSRCGYPTAVKALRDAADTIWQLRDDLQRANAENAKLREELADAPKCETCEAMLDCDECLRADVSHKERRRLSAENAELRELVQDMYRRFHGVVIENWSYSSEDFYMYEQRMRELGVEVN